MQAMTRRLRTLADQRPRVVAYCAAALAVLAVLALWVIFRAFTPGVSLLNWLSPAACAVALLGGLGPGLAATTLGLAIASAAAPEESGGALYIFASSGIAVSVLGEFVRRLRRRHHRMDLALAEREAHLGSIYDTAPDGLIVIDEAGFIRSFSAGAERIFGWSAAETLGRNVSMLMPTPDRESHNNYLGRYLQSGERRIIGIGRIVVGERKDGSTFPMELAIGEIRSERGRAFTGFVRDITERQATKARLQELQAELVHMSRLTAMGEMASVLAHELNQPLSAIANYLSGARRLLERPDDNPERVGDALEKAAAQAVRAGEIIRRLRDFLSRGEGERRVVSIQKLAQEACALALVGAKEGGVRVQYKFDPAIDLVLVDRLPVQQVILNLVRNALDAMDETTRRELVVTTASAADGMAMVSIADTGSGVEAGTKLFEPFITTKPEGMGVGLSISRTIVESHGGRIWTEPNPGGGAIFRFTVPLAPVAEPAKAGG
jgi:two-component system sensor kinase FixL